MQASMFCKANFLLFLDGDNQIVGYQLDDTSIKKMKFIDPKYPTELPEGTENTLLIEDVRCEIKYEKDHISDEEAKITQYEIKESNPLIANRIDKNKDKIKLVTVDNESECPAFAPINLPYTGKLFDCDFCINKPQCYEKLF